jgi:hypothetical protein
MLRNLRIKPAYAAWIAAAATLVGVARLAAQAEPVTCDSKCAAIVFGDSGKALPATDQQAIATQLPLKPGPEGLVDIVCEQPASSQVSLRDLNGDGTSEVFVLFGNACLSGFAGSSLALYIKDASGKYQVNLGFPAGGYDVLETKNAGYPDLQIGGPGFCHPVWRWNGKTYDFLRNQEEEPGGCAGVEQQ